jgi:hypothetical protein
LKYSDGQFLALPGTSLPPFFDAVKNVRDVIHRLEKVVHRLFVKVFGLNLAHRKEEAFHLLPEHVPGVGRIDLKQLVGLGDYDGHTFGGNFLCWRFAEQLPDADAQPHLRSLYGEMLLKKLCSPGARHLRRANQSLGCEPGKLRGLLKVDLAGCESIIDVRRELK